MHPGDIFKVSLADLKLVGASNPGLAVVASFADWCIVVIRGDACLIGDVISSATFNPSRSNQSREGMLYVIPMSARPLMPLSDMSSTAS